MCITPDICMESRLQAECLQARFVTREANNGMSQCDIAFALAKMAYRNGSTDEISAYVLSLDSKGQERPIDHTQVNVPCSNGDMFHAEPILAPQTPAQYNTLEGPIFKPVSNGSLDEKACTHIQGMHQHEQRSVHTQFTHIVASASRMLATTCHHLSSACADAGDRHTSSAASWWHVLPWHSIKWGSCAIAVAGLVVLSGRRHR